MAELGLIDLCERARSAVAKGDLRKGQHYFEKAIEVKPDSVDANYGLGTVCYLLRDFPAAAKAFKAVLALDSRHPGATINLGALCNLQGDYEEAVQHLRRGIQLDGKRSEGFYNLGLAYRKLDKLDLAIQAYREAHRLNPRMVEAVYNLANLYFDMERYDQAAQFYAKALEINPRFVKARQGLERVEMIKQKEEKPSSRIDLPALGIQTNTEIENDKRYDRQITPERDGDFVARFHERTAIAEQAAEGWLQSTVELDAALRGFSIALSGNADKQEYDAALQRFHGAINHFRQADVAFGKKLEEIDEYRDKLVDRG